MVKFSKQFIFLVSIFSFLLSQVSYSLEDLNTSSLTYGVEVGPTFYTNQVTIHYFGHYNWGLCTARFDQLNDMFIELINSGYTDIQLLGVGKSTHLSSLNNWTNSFDVPVCADSSPFSTWQDWGASQRDLFILDSQGQIVFQENISGGFNELEVSNLIISLIPQPLTCDEAENPQGCFQSGCEDGYECIDDSNNGGNCVPSSCFCDETYGEWFCTEDCNGGSCYPIQQLGDINNDNLLNVLDVVLIVGFILGNDIPSDSQLLNSDLNSDGSLNVLDVVSLVSLILGN